MDIAAALLSIAIGDRDRAVNHLVDAVRSDPRSRLAPALSTYLSTSNAAHVYDAPAAFEAFIDGGDNVALYERLIAMLTDVHRELRPESVVDIGCGDGRVTTAVLADSTTSVDLVEPSRELLDDAVTKLGAGRSVVPHMVDAAGFVAGTTDQRWDLVQATFSLHTIDPTDRAPVLKAVAARTDFLVLAEFDVPSFRDRSSRHAEYAAARYEQGLREYDGSDLVSQGFLMPVLVGQFDPAEPRHTFEQPLDDWVDELRRAGFTSVTTAPILDYWWAPAVMITGRVEP